MIYIYPDKLSTQTTITKALLKRNERTEKQAEEFYGNLLQQALSEIDKKLEGGATMIVGTMFKGGGPEEHFPKFYAAQRKLSKQEISVFDQIPYTDYSRDKKGENVPFRYDIKFEKFFRPLIQSGKITALYTLPNWEQSEGTRSEVNYAKEAGIPVYEI